jgi:4-amino-4-deoxy-L-arabinose transferase-like glycosyltransferase
MQCLIKMQQFSTKKYHLKTTVTSWLLVFLIAHGFVWTVVPLLVRYNLPLDAIEGSIWGQQLEWGYDKNPYLNGWLTALAVRLGGPSGWMIYLFSQISVLVCFLGVWHLAKAMLAPLHALAAVMMLEGMHYYHLHAIDFNDNTLELGLWSLSIYFFYRALSYSSRSAWIFTGLCCGLGLMAKYYTASLLAAMLLFVLLHKDSRKQLKTLGPYLGMSSFLIVILPHLFWLVPHDFITVKYVFARASSTPHWSNHLFFPLQFAWQQLEVFLPACLLLTSLYYFKKSPQLEASLPNFSWRNFNCLFLICVGLGPFLLTILLSFIMGIKLRAGWGMPLLSCWGILLLLIAPPRISEKRWRVFLFSIFSLMLILASAYTVSLIRSKDESSANFPGKEIAEHMSTLWHNTYAEPLAFVAGSRWVGGNIAFYSADHPAVFIEWDKKRAPWIALDQLNQKGAIFVWSITDHETMPKEIYKQFPRLSASQVLEFSWKRNVYHLKPIRIGMAILPPARARSLRGALFATRQPRL